ncbi:MAG: DUF3365 domain-containing protein [Planctomycetes bacterium]|nr:DUF3365 domain-containing protein [Planctomycetota bacterium]
MTRHARLAHLVLLPVLALSTAGCADDPKPRGFSDPEDARQGRELALAFQKALRSELENAIAAQGPIGAIAVCGERAQAIADGLARDGMRVRRISDRPRNPANAADARELQMLESWRGTPAERRAGLGEARTRDGTSRLYLPISIPDALCLTCHGPVEAMAPELREKLAARYPADRATGYALGDLRGALVVESGGTAR